MKKTVGSICSGIEAASVAWEPLGFKFNWFSEIAPYPSKVLKARYPSVPNLGDLTYLPELLLHKKIESPDLICGGTPCQAFSLAGWKNGLNDSRGNLTLKFAEIITANDSVRMSDGKEKSIVFWENVEGVLTDKTNAFGCFLSSLAGLKEPIQKKRWASAGVLFGPDRNIAWRILDAKFFGVPQQRRRLYLLAGGKDFHPEDILFEEHTHELKAFPKFPLLFKKEGYLFEVFREYTDCLYSSYGTKWNGNAAAYNGSLYLVQNSRIRRFSALECERLMGFSDNYSLLPDSKKTNQYQAVGNSWAVPVIRWIGNRLIAPPVSLQLQHIASQYQRTNEYDLIEFEEKFVKILPRKIINCSVSPEEQTFISLEEIVSANTDESLYISPVGAYGIIRRKNERSLRINKRLEEVLLETSSQMAFEEIEKKSRVQHRSLVYDQDFNCPSEGKSKMRVSTQALSQLMLVEKN